MLDYLFDNKEWIFSGIGVLVISLTISLLINKKKKAKVSEKTANVVNESKIKGSAVNTIQGDNVNINQTIINHVKETINEKQIEKQKSIVGLHEFERAKRKIINQKAIIRTYINAILASARAQNLDAKLEIRHITDVVEELINENHDRILEELRGLKEDGLIEFKEDNDTLISPYTKVIITNKFYSKVL